MKCFLFSFLRPSIAFFAVSRACVVAVREFRHVRSHGFGIRRGPCDSPPRAAAPARRRPHRDAAARRDCILPYVRHVAGFWNCNDLTAANGPGQGDGGWRTIMCCTNTPERRVTQQHTGRSPEWGIGHYWYSVLLAPWQ